jgi:hypothetical protein
VLRIAADEYLAVVSKTKPIHPQTGEACDATTTWRGRRIEIWARPQALEQLEVAWHEMVEAMNYQYNWNLDHKVIDSLGHAIASTLYDNIPFWMQMGLAQHPDNVANGVREEKGGDGK